MSLHPVYRDPCPRQRPRPGPLSVSLQPCRESGCRLGNDAGARPVSTLPVMKQQIASHSGDHAEIIVNRLKEHQSNYGYSAVTGE